MKNLNTILLLLLLLGSLDSCYYDIEEELYPAYANSVCDTNNVTYVKDIEPLIRNNCLACHGTGIGLGNITLETYNDLQPYIQNGALLGSMEHQAGYSPMPKGGTKLSQCSISLLKSWISKGSLNN